MGLKYYYSRKCALVLAILLLLDAVHPAIALALTSGPSQPEVQGFKPIEATNMVDLFTGDFNYNLPLFEIDGYPVNMSYNTNSRMEDEASWVGMGWTLNPGSVNREVRGFPDDFKDEEVVKKYNFKNDVTVGISGALDLEVFGLKTLKVGKGFFWNNKKGYGTQTSVTVGKSIGEINASYNTQSGLDLGVSLGIMRKIKENEYSLNVGTSISSRQGLRAIDFGMSLKKGNAKNMPGSIQYELGGFTYFPTNPMPMQNNSFTFHGRAGSEVFGAHPAFNLDGYIVVQGLAMKQQSQRAFGYLYHYEGLKDSSNLIDCNRENQLVYREGMPSLPVSYGTGDNFSISGQGVSGQFRLYKNDVGVLHNSYVSNTSSAGKFGIEIGALNIFHGGADIAGTNVESKSQIWTDDNKVKNVLSFTDNDSLYERAYFKDASERMVDDSVFISKIGGTNPAYVKLTNNKLTPIAERTLEIEKNKISIGSNSVSTVLKKTGRGKRSNVMSYLTRAEAAKFGLEKDIKSYNFNQLYYGTGACQSPTSVSQTIYKPHHIHEITINKPDGSRYIFGLPAYNLRQKEVSFSVNQNTPTGDGQSYISYSGTDTTSSNTNGRDNFVENQSIPPHAHSYLLTGVLSDDYVDVKNDGITDDDLGNAVKFNYSKQTDNYKWRTPYSANKARLMQGMKTDRLDDKGSYVYGEKEIWYVHSIESRNMIAQFYVSGNDANRRRDGFGVLGEQGGIDSSFNQGLRKLDSIKIFSKSDLLKNGVNAVPIKQVNFEYNYDICPNSFSSSYANGTGGKLTLKKVYFTFGNNGKGKLNAYKFTYKIKNPVTTATLAYDTLKVDRWGFYKQHPAGYPAYSDFPYSLQDSALTNQTAGAWNMDSIFLPSGGRIAIDYESDDYAYVQNKRAGQMFFIKGFAQDTIATNFSVGSPNANSLYLTPLSPYGNVTNSKYIVIDVSAYSNLLNNTANPKNEAVKLFFEDVKDVYFKAKVQLTTDSKTKEYITGYAGCDQSLIHYNGSTKNLFVPINSITESGFSVNPITLAALQTLRLNLPDIAYDFSGRSDDINNPTKNSMKNVLTGLLGFAQSISDMINTYTKNRVKLQWAKTVDVGNSWVRLANPTYKKFGGGSRVKKISVFDNWTIANGGGESNYTQSFSYTTNLNGKVISSGVASYEPAIGGDEISLKQPLTYQEKIKLAPDNSYYAETPIGESFYPGAGVGYNEVRVESVYPNVKRSGTGYTLNKFYTAKDFPTISDYTNIVAGSVKIKPSVISKLFKFNVVDQRGVSQGFTIETNDMHGKPKEEAVYNQQGALISATNYSYKVDDINATTFHLNNDVQVVDPNGSITTRKMGVETDVWEEMQDEYVNTQTMGMAVNVDGFTIFLIPLVIPTPLPIIQNDKKGLKTAITTKHIRRMGMLDKVTKTVDGSTLATKNMLYDSETGDVLLTQTENEFNDPIYNFTYPAHWVYDGMGPAYKNIGSIFKGMQFQGYGNFTPSSLPNPTTYFAPGDELSLINEATGQFEAEKYFIVKDNAGVLAIYDKLGNPFIGTSKYTVKVIRSGRRNKSSTPIGSIASLASPLNAGGTAISINANTKVIQAESREFSDSWLMQCKKTRSVVDPTRDSLLIYGIINPYITGLRGNWRGVKNFVHYNSRNIKDIPTSTDIRRDGFIPNFAPYWTNSSNVWASTPSSTWVLSDSINLYNTRGNEIESYDANNIPSSAYYGYNGTQVAAVTSNSAHREMTFDSFEDYLFKNSCGNDTSYLYDKNVRFFDPKNLALNWSVVDSAAHTGKYSLRLGSTVQYFAGTLLQSNYCPTGCTNCKTQSNAAAKSGGTTSAGGTYTACADCLPLFSLDINKKYVLSYWIANDSSLTCNAIPQNISIGLLSGNAPITLNKVSTSPVIDGWQKIEVSFTATGTAADLTFKLSNQSTKSCYFDDIRVLPFNAKMKSYVYDIYSRRLMAELDENNYATFYEYDDEGILVRIKRETETGIQTVKEARNFLKPNN